MAQRATPNEPKKSPPRTASGQRVVRYQIDVKSLRPEQVELLERHVGCARQAWNWATYRWLDWQRNLKDSVEHDAAVVALATLPVDPTLDQLGDAIMTARSLARGLDGNKDWQNQAYARARAVHGESRFFQNAFSLGDLYRREAKHSESRLHWWHAEGAGRPKGSPAHGVSTFAYQAALADFARTVRAYWDQPRYSKRTGKRLGAPRLKEKDPSRGGFALMNLTTSASSPWKIVDADAPGHRLVFPNLGSIRMIGNVRQLRRWTARGGSAASARFTRKGTRWWVSISVAVPGDQPGFAPPVRPTARQRAGGAVGVDLGVKQLATLSTGEVVAGRRDALRKQQLVVAALQRKFDRQHRTGSPGCFAPDGAHIKGKCRWVRGEVPMSRSARGTQRRLAAMNDLFTRQRHGALHELTADLVKRFEMISIEDLNVAGMTARSLVRPDPNRPGAFKQNRRRSKGGLNRAILDASFGEFRRQLEYKTKRAGVTLEVVDRFAPTSKKCSGCSSVKPKLRLSQRTYRCEQCGLVLDRDHNAAINIRALGLARSPSGDAASEPGTTPTASRSTSGVGVTDAPSGLDRRGSVEQDAGHGSDSLRSRWPGAGDSTGRVSDPSSPTAV